MSKNEDVRVGEFTREFQAISLAHKFCTFLFFGPTTNLFFNKDILFSLYMYFFRSSVFFHLTTIHLFLFSQGQTNIDIDLDLSCLLRNNIPIAYFVFCETLIVI